MNHLKELKRACLYGSWSKQDHSRDGYSVVLATPMDMPFLLQLALEGLEMVDMKRCHEILVVPDGSCGDGGRQLKRIIHERNDKRTRYVEPGLRWRYLMPYVHNHPAMMALGTEAVCTRYAFVHDMDAFLSDATTIEKLFDEMVQRSMVAMGVTARWDRGFQAMNMTIPGTWELFYDTTWLRKWPRQMVFGRSEVTPAGRIEFDSMLYPQYLDHASGRIGVSSVPHDIVHFNGTIRTFRNYRKSQNQSVNDDLFRLLLLSLIESATIESDTPRLTPEVNELSQGLKNPSARIQYNSETNQRGYGEFRSMIAKMVQCPVFQGERASMIVERLQPFDEHFGYSDDAPFHPALKSGDFRRSGLS